MADTTEVATATRKVKISTTRGEKKIIDFSGTTWKELRKAVSNAGYDLQNMKAVEGNTRHTLEHDSAIVPEGDFKLFLMPLKTKAGAKVVKKAAKKAAPKKAVKKAAKKAAPKKAAKKTVKAATRTAKKSQDNGVADVVDSVGKSKQTNFGTDEEMDNELRELSKGFPDVKP